MPFRMSRPLATPLSVARVVSAFHCDPRDLQLLTEGELERSKLSAALREAKRASWRRQRSVFLNGSVREGAFALPFSYGSSIN